MIVTDHQHLTEETLRVTAGEGVDVVIDHVAGEVLPLCPLATKPFGHIVCVGRVGGPRALLNIDDLCHRHLTLHCVEYNSNPLGEKPTQVANLHDRVLPAVAAGSIAPVIDSTYAFGDFRAGLSRLRAGANTGKVVFTLS